MRKIPTKYFCIVASLVLLVHAAYSQSSKAIDWKVDIDFLAIELPQRHYNLFSVKTKTDFISRLEKIKSTSGNYSDFENAIRLQQLVASCGDSHTRISFGQLVDRARILPLQLYWFADGLYILQTTQENSEILGYQILSLNRIPLKTIIDSLSTVATIDNHAMVKNVVKELFPLLQLHEHFGFTSGTETVLELKNLQGDTKTYSLKPGELNKQNRVPYQPDSVALCFRNDKAYFSDHYLTSAQTYYLMYNKCSGREVELKRGNVQNADKLPSFQEFEDNVFQQLTSISVKKIVCDLRFNEGGNSSQGTQFISKLSKYLKKNPHVNMYVIIGRNTFSSAIINAMDFKKQTKAVFVGEETAGKPNHFGELKTLTLPSSGIRVSYSTKYFKEVPENVNTITPDIKTETSFFDFKRGIDPAYEWIRKQ